MAQTLAYVIPAFNEGRVIADVIRDLRAKGPAGKIIVIDDSSVDDTGDAARSAGAIVLRHIINRGQGAALQTGFDAALKLGVDLVATFDADGQHDPRDVGRFIEQLDNAGADVALGSRFLETGSNVPTGRKLLLRAGVVFTRIVSRVSLTDTHNGLRVFRAPALARIRITEDRMAHASELIDLIGRLQLRYVEVPCTIRYTDYSVQKGQRWSAAPRIAADFLLGKLMR